MRWRLDDEAIAYPTYAIIDQNKGQLRKHPGFFNICIHKGLSANGTQPFGPNDLPNFGNPDDIVKAATDKSCAGSTRKAPRWDAVRRFRGDHPPAA